MRLICVWLSCLFNARRQGAAIAGGKNVNLPNKEHTLVLKMEDVQKKRQTDLDDAGISKTAREEKVKARDQKAKDAEMMKLYREHVLGEKPQEGFVHHGAIQPAPKPAAKEKEVGSFGD
jgi:hypothetical protein